MAAVLKCTKITNLGESLLVTNAYSVSVEYVNPGTTPPTPGSVRLEIDKNDMEVPADMQTVIDDALLLVGSNTMNWSI
jgi:hypothetical protein